MRFPRRAAGPAPWPAIGPRAAPLWLVALSACALSPLPPPAPPPPEGTVVGSAEMARIRCLVVAPFENTTDVPRLGEIATSAMLSSIDPELTRIFPIQDLAALFRDTLLEIPEGGVSPRLALALGERTGADGVLYGAVEGRARGSSTDFLVTVRLQAVGGRELLFANVAAVHPTADEPVEVALRRSLLIATRTMLLKLGSPGTRSCFDPELVRRARELRAAAAVPRPTPPSPPSLAPPPPSPLSLTQRQARWTAKIAARERFVLEGVSFAGRSAILVVDDGLIDLAKVLVAAPGEAVRLEAFVDATESPSEDTRVSMAMAMAVTRRLVALGVARDQITVEARGGEAPISPNFSLKGRVTNRRMEIVPLPKL